MVVLIPFSSAVDLKIQQRKKYKNRPKFPKVIAKIKVAPFLLRHSVYHLHIRKLLQHSTIPISRLQLMHIADIYLCYSVTLISSKTEKNTASNVNTLTQGTQTNSK